MKERGFYPHNIQHFMLTFLVPNKYFLCFFHNINHFVLIFSQKTKCLVLVSFHHINPSGAFFSVLDFIFGIFVTLLIFWEIFEVLDFLIIVFTIWNPY